jgi:hypothetical protein
MDTASGNNKICERSNPEMCVMLYTTAYHRARRGRGIRTVIELTPTRLLRLSKDLPHDWSEQRHVLDFAA